MPAAEFSEFYQRHGLSVTAAHFFVSPPAASVRASVLGL